MDNINPKLIHGFHADFSRGDRARIRVALDSIPGDADGRNQLWGKFERNEATLLFGRNAAGSIAFFLFFEVRVKQRVLNMAASGPHVERREMFLSGAFALQPSRTLVETTFPQLDQFARALDCQTITFSTVRRGLVAKVTALPGWSVVTDLAGDAPAASPEILVRKQI